MMRIFVFTWLFLFVLIGCQSEETEANTAYRATRTVSWDGVSVDVVIDKPANNAVDVLLVYHGTVLFDSKIMEAANTTLDNFKRMVNRNDMMIVSVAYPEENLLIGDNVRQSEAALLWLNNRASTELGITMKKIFLGGHSQGGYIVTILNTRHVTNGVIANGPGPFNLVYRCGLEETGQTPASIPCGLLRSAYGTTIQNPNSYFNRSLLNYTNGFLSDILFVQGLNDAPIQMYSWPVFREQVSACTTCKRVEFLEVSGFGHTALFDSPQAKVVFNQFLDSR
jgi:poly(3-hydroxybutyrate) depolymerase